MAVLLQGSYGHLISAAFKFYFHPGIPGGDFVFAQQRPFLKCDRILYALILKCDLLRVPVDHFRHKFTLTANDIFDQEIIFSPDFNRILTEREDQGVGIRQKTYLTFIFRSFFKNHFPIGKRRSVLIIKEGAGPDAVSAEKITVCDGKGFINGESFLAHFMFKRIGDAVIENMQIPDPEAAVFAVEIDPIVSAAVPDGIFSFVIIRAVCCYGGSGSLPVLFFIPSAAFTELFNFDFSLPLKFIK